jgi:uncharacterized protein with FMN-binding domain
MKRAVLAIVSTVAAVVMLLTFKTHSLTASTTPPAAVSNSSGTSSDSGTTSSSGSDATSSTGSTSSSSSATASAAKTYTGSAADTRYGPVQVQITVKKGKLTAVTAVDYPQGDPRDQEINSYAIPALNSEATSAGNANIDMISGATYTSQGYISSLQSALDQAGL